MLHHFPNNAAANPNNLPLQHVASNRITVRAYRKTSELMNNVAQRKRVIQQMANPVTDIKSLWSMRSGMIALHGVGNYFEGIGGGRFHTPSVSIKYCLL